MSNYSETPEIQSAPSFQTKLWQIVGLLLIAGGLLVMAWGGWMFYRQQAELYNPPAPIVDSSAVEVAEVINSPSPQPQPSPTEPAAGAASTNDPADISTPTPGPINQTETAEPTPPPEPSIDAEAVAGEEETALQPTNFNTDDVPSLADNPLLVVEDVDEQIEVPALESEPVPEAAVSPPTRIVAESINLDTEVVETGWQTREQDGVLQNVWVVADYAAGWHKNSALPGQGGNVVLSGHHNIKGEVFRYIVDLEVGDTITLFAGDQSYEYVVNDKFIVKDKGEPDSVRQANARWIGPFNEERLTLVTCWPYNSNTHRVIVIARPL